MCSNRLQPAAKLAMLALVGGALQLSVSRNPLRLLASDTQKRERAPMRRIPRFQAKRIIGLESRLFCAKTEPGWGVDLVHHRESGLISLSSHSAGRASHLFRLPF